MENELTTLQLRLERATRDIDREVQRFEAVGRKAWPPLSGSRMRRINPWIDPNFETTPQDLEESLRLHPEQLGKARKDLAHAEWDLSNLQSFTANIRQDIRQLKRRLAEIDRELTGKTLTPEKRAQLREERRSKVGTLRKKREALSIAGNDIQKSRKRIRALREKIRQIRLQFRA